MIPADVEGVMIGREPTRPNQRGPLHSASLSPVEENALRLKLAAASHQSPGVASTAVGHAEIIGYGGRH